MPAVSNARAADALPPYPPARRSDQVDVLHGEPVADPYRWLEEAMSPETRDWVRAQQALTDGWLARIPTREQLRHELTELWDYPKATAPFRRGTRWFQWRNDGLQNQSVLYTWDAGVEPVGSPGGGLPPGRVLLDPNTLAADGTVSVPTVSVADNGELLAYATAVAGSDWLTWRVRTVGTGTDLDDVVEWSKFCEAAWLPDGSGFFYSALPEPEPGAELAGPSRGLAVQLHRLGMPAEDDDLVYAAADSPEWLPAATISEGEPHLVVSVTRGTGRETRVFLQDLTDPAASLLPLVDDFSCVAEVIAVTGGRALLLTDHGAPRRRVMVATRLPGEPARWPGPGDWEEVIGQAPETLTQAWVFGGRLVCHYLRDAQSCVRVHDLDGGNRVEVALPGPCGVTEATGRPGLGSAYLAVASFIDSGSLHRLDTATGALHLVTAPQAALETAQLVTEQVWSTSADGTPVPMFLTHRRDVTPTGEVPTLLYGYGGFNIAVLPSFSVAHALWVQRGGLLAVATLRGGGEYGTPWYDAGRLAHKQNVFDDFTGCATQLVSTGWTRPGRLAIQGRSNGGLLVGACVTQHPELFAAAVCEVGVLDLLRFHRFTIGWAWTSDYGDPDDPQQYPWPRSYSPLHALRPGRSYPAMLVVTGDHDDRVVPAHSYKFTAAAQQAQAGSAPVLLRVETAAGHGDGKPTSKVIAERCDVLAFLEQTLGVADERAARRH